MTIPTGAFRFVCRGLAAFAVVALIPISATGQSAGRHALQRAPARAISGAPLGQRVQTVLLKMADDPVAVVRSRAPGKQLAEAQRQSIERDLRGKQDAIVPSIQRMGGTVLAQFQHAINGIKVRGTPQQIRAFGALPGVIAVKSVRTYHLDNAESVPFIGTPQAWQGPPGLHGEHIRIAVIDTGVDYTHANFGGPGTVAAWNTAFAHSTEPADPTLFGPNAPKVKGGTDLVGDAYDGSPTSVPMPDPNPLDCAGHGSHTSGTATGFGVTSAGTTFNGHYDATTPGQSFSIGPGVAPLADLYMVRVFGCTGPTNVVVDAIDWAVAHDMQVISMSLGADFGNEDDSDAEASENAVDAGIVVVASAGNAGTIPYVTGNPSTGEKVISAAAMDSRQFLSSGVHITLSSAGGADGVDANPAVPLPSGSVPAVILTSAGKLALGCASTDYPSSGAAGALVIVSRGTCTFVAKATLAAAAGAVAIGVVNNTTGFFNPAIPGVTIPFIELQQSDSATFTGAPSPVSATIAFANIPNAAFETFASFTSSGPRGGDGHLKPDITAPGVSIFSTAVGTGNQGEFLSGTSMAAPHVAGSAALAIQAHPGWDADEVADAIVNTADATKLVSYSPQIGGNGVVQPFGATQTSVFAHAMDGTPSVSFGVSEFTRDFSAHGPIVVENRGSAPASFELSVVQGQPSTAHTATVSPSSITLGGHESRTVQVHLAVPLATVGDSSAFRQVQGRVLMTPSQGNNGVALSVPYYLVPRARSLVNAHLGESGDARVVALSNRSSGMTGTADFYAWGLRGTNNSLATGLRAVGVQSYTDPTLGQILVFAVNTFGRTSNPVTNVYDILVDINGDGVPDYDIEAADLGVLTTGTANGVMVTAVFNLATGAGVLEFLATAPTDGTTVLMPVVAADAGITASNPRFSYIAQTTDTLTGNIDAIATPAGFNAFNTSISTGAFVTLPPGTSASVPLTINRQEFRKTPALGQMVVSLENTVRGGNEALLLSLGDD
jgi:minor extracellular serine protease Vpr